MKILIDNCVPTNNGDAALVFSLYERLAEKGNQVAFSTMHYELVKKIYPSFKWNKTHLNKFSYKLFFKLPFGKYLWKIYILLRLALFKNEYKDADLIVSAPGGYIHSYYGIEERMYILYICKKVLNKKVGIFSQSIGNLSDRDRIIINRYGKELDFIFARDKISLNRLLDYGLDKNVVLTRDAAFMLPNPIKKKSMSSGKKIAISVREWNKEGRSKEKYFHLIYTIVNYLINKGFQVTFLSTCQGLDNYVDDSDFAKEIVKTFEWENNSNIKIDDTFYRLTELQSELGKYDFIIGTRLHMCILGLLNGVPSLNISYEEKGKEVYRYLNASEYTVDYNDQRTDDEMETVVENFISMTTKKKEKLFEEVKKIEKEQLSYMDTLFNMINN